MLPWWLLTIIGTWSCMNKLYLFSALINKSLETNQTGMYDVRTLYFLSIHSYNVQKESWNLFDRLWIHGSFNTYLHYFNHQSLFCNFRVYKEKMQITYFLLSLNFVFIFVNLEDYYSFKIFKSIWCKIEQLAFHFNFHDRVNLF